MGTSDSVSLYFGQIAEKSFEQCIRLLFMITSNEKKSNKKRSIGGDNRGEQFFSFFIQKYTPYNFHPAVKNLMQCHVNMETEEIICDMPGREETFPERK
ncbi:MAG: hypothetical protein LUG27_11475 [Clostridiales bacterium]|nr:hypothetical protein [Clostridiales bacterium]